MSGVSVSVVMAVRNGAGLLGEAIASVRSQTTPVAEIVVVDGHSTDDTVAVAEAAGARVVAQRGPTLADAYNTGIDETVGSHVAFLSHDDVWSPRKSEVQLALLAVNPSAAAAIGLAEFVLLDGRTAPPGFRRELLGAPRPARIMETLLAPRATFEAVGPFRAEVSPADDADWYARFGDLGLTLAIADEVVLTKRITATSTAHTAANGRELLLRLLRESVERKRVHAHAAQVHREPAGVGPDAEVDGPGGAPQPE